MAINKDSEEEKSLSITCKFTDQIMKDIDIIVKENYHSSRADVVKDIVRDFLIKRKKEKNELQKS